MSLDTQELEGMGVLVQAEGGDQGDGQVPGLYTGGQTETFREVIHEIRRRLQEQSEMRGNGRHLLGLGGGYLDDKWLIVPAFFAEEALEILLEGPCYHMFEVGDNDDLF